MEKPAHDYEIEKKREAVRRNEVALATMREGLHYPYNEVYIRSFNTLFPNYAGYREMARLLSMDAKVKISEGDTNAAVKEYGKMMERDHHTMRVEGMALAKPVICFLNDAFRAFHPEWEDCPIVSASPDQLVGILRGLVESPERRRELGQAGPGYVRRYHSLEATAARMDDIYRRLWS